MAKNRGPKKSGRVFKAGSQFLVRFVHQSTYLWVIGQKLRQFLWLDAYCLGCVETFVDTRGRPFSSTKDFGRNSKRWFGDLLVIRATVGPVNGSLNARARTRDRSWGGMFSITWHNGHLDTSLHTACLPKVLPGGAETFSSVVVPIKTEDLVSYASSPLLPLPASKS